MGNFGCAVTSCIILKLCCSFCNSCFSVGMADFQLLPPGLNSIDHTDEPVDHNIYQLSGQ